MIYTGVIVVGGNGCCDEDCCDGGSSCGGGGGDDTVVVVDVYTIFLLSPSPSPLAVRNCYHGCLIMLGSAGRCGAGCYRTGEGEEERGGVVRSLDVTVSGKARWSGARWGTGDTGAGHGRHTGAG